ncbi:sulfite exporter TauE/SafE family protein [Chachezhania antarctica]|uniref:sulfite exporter TauE/SafE family protein n=1 Tax=Chachezhania antarctica TaxID=2340860 RepID=UPI000EABD68E|nr:sulfite exporter TauE/SafE family protein [Chachezhania antarctica]|tara:strand:- start:25 stop:768 length:744 start_codon:yes stop_codon:yes gene_type:complete
MTLTEFAIIAVAMALGGLVKGVTGAGAPVIAVPVIAAVLSLRDAVAIMALSNLVSNLVQLWQFRETRMRGPLPWILAAASFAGAWIGTEMLVSLPAEALILGLAGIVLIYVLLRLARPGFHLSLPLATKLAGPAGLAGGILQGAVGLSAPVSITFLNALRLERAVFVPTISLSFVAMCLSQVPVQISHGLLTWPIAAVSMAGLVGQLAAMSLGGRLAKNVSAQLFDRIVLVLLVAMALRMVWQTLAG